MSNVKENFLRYVQIETTSSETSGTCPSTPNQWVLAKMLVDELHAMGIENARVDDHCYVYATIPAKGNHPAKVGLISHMDTSDGVKGPTHPVIIEHYDGRHHAQKRRGHRRLPVPEGLAGAGADCHQRRQRAGRG